MKLYLVFAALILAGCERPEPVAQAQMEAAQPAEKSAEARRPLADASLVDIVKQALNSESSLDARKIDVENRNGNIQLHGSVESSEQREKAARIVGAVGGVRNVQNNLTVDESAAAGGTLPPKKEGTFPPKKE